MHFLWWSVGCATMLAGCSAFNMSPECDKTGAGVARSIAMPDDSHNYDPARIGAIVQVEEFSEFDSGYNQRSCSARITVGMTTTTVRYRVRQSEGLHDWYEIEFLDPNEPGLMAAVAQARALYAGI